VIFEARSYRTSALATLTTSGVICRCVSISHAVPLNVKRSGSTFATDRSVMAVRRSGAGYLYVRRDLWPSLGLLPVAGALAPFALRWGRRIRRRHLSVLNGSPNIPTSTPQCRVTDRERVGVDDSGKSTDNSTDQLAEGAGFKIAAEGAANRIDRGD
jgi:hypothetical protein